MRKIFLVTDYNCNNACISCAKRLDEQGRLTLDQLIGRLDAVKPKKEDFIEISGGEPTLRQDLLELFHHIKTAYGSNLILLSNGRRFKDSSFAESIKATGIDRVMTTFYGAEPALHDAITARPGSFSDTLEGLKNLEELGLPISVKTIILRQNYQQLPEFVDFAYDTFPSAWVSLHGLIMRGQASDNKEAIVARYADVKPFVERSLDRAISRGKNLGVFIIPTCIIDPCYWDHLSVNWKQITNTMVYISPEEMVIGNLDVAQPDYCRDCLVGENCSWAWESAWKEYTALFGTEELSRLTLDQLRCKE